MYFIKVSIRVSTNRDSAGTWSSPTQTLIQVSRLEPHISMSLTCVTATPHLLVYSCRRHENTGFKSGDLNQRNVSVRPTPYCPRPAGSDPAPAGQTLRQRVPYFFLGGYHKLTNCSHPRADTNARLPLSTASGGTEGKGDFGGFAPNPLPWLSQNRIG